MDTLKICLINLQNKVFKLLPMREAMDKGEDVHLLEYLENLLASVSGAFECYQELSVIEEIVEVRNNIAFLRANPDVEFKRWRTIVLRSTRLVHTVITRKPQEE